MHALPVSYAKLKMLFALLVLLLNLIIEWSQKHNHADSMTLTDGDGADLKLKKNAPYISLMGELCGI